MKYTLKATAFICRKGECAYFFSDMAKKWSRGYDQQNSLLRSEEFELERSRPLSVTIKTHGLTLI